MNDLINQINNKLDIVEVISEFVPLSKKGKNFWGVCPFHQDSNPSMSVSPEKQIYKCFSCGASGGIVNFIADYKKIPFTKALSELAQRIGIEFEDTSKPKYSPEQQKLIDVFTDATLFMQYMLASEEATIANEYVNKRGLTPRIIERFKIGYAPQNGLKDFLLKKGHDEAVIINASLINSRGNDFFHGRLIFPISNEYGDVVGYSARTLSNEEAKYINSSESLVFHKSSVLYNYSNAQDVAFREKSIYICEGQMDVIALDKAGVANAVAVMGTALTKEHLKLIEDLKVILNFDKDKAGESATLKSIKLLLEHKFKVYIVKNEEGKDADEIFATHGKEKLIEVLDKQISGLEWVYEKHFEKYSSKTPEDISDLVKSFGKYITYASPIEKDFYVNKLAQDLPISIDTIKEMLNIRKSYTRPHSYEPQKPEPKEETKTIKINYSYALIRSLLKKDFLISFYEKHQDKINFLDRQLIEIGKYLVSVKNKEKVARPSPSLTAKVSEIMKESSLIANDEKEFEQMIAKVNNEFYNHYISEYKVKLEKELDETKKEHYLKALIELKHKKGAKQ